MSAAAIMDCASFERRIAEEFIGTNGPFRVVIRADPARAPESITKGFDLARAPAPFPSLQGGPGSAVVAVVGAIRLYGRSLQQRSRSA